MAQVFLAQQRCSWFKVPVNVECRVGDVDTAVGFRRIVVITLILEYGNVGKYGEAMCESAWHEKLPVVFGGKLYSHVFAIGGGAAAYVDGDIKHSAYDASHQFCLREWRALEVKSAHDSRVDRLSLSCTNCTS